MSNSSTCFGPSHSHSVRGEMIDSAVADDYKLAGAADRTCEAIRYHGDPDVGSNWVNQINSLVTAAVSDASFLHSEWASVVPPPFIEPVSLALQTLPYPTCTAESITIAHETDKSLLARLGRIEDRLTAELAAVKDIDDTVALLAESRKVAHEKDAIAQTSQTVDAKAIIQEESSVTMKSLLRDEKAGYSFRLIEKNKCSLASKCIWRQVFLTDELDQWSLNGSKAISLTKRRTPGSVDWPEEEPHYYKATENRVMDIHSLELDYFVWARREASFRIQITRKEDVDFKKPLMCLDYEFSWQNFSGKQPPRSGSTPAATEAARKAWRAANAATTITLKVGKIKKGVVCKA